LERSLRNKWTQTSGFKDINPTLVCRSLAGTAPVYLAE